MKTKSSVIFSLCLFTFFALFLSSQFAQALSVKQLNLKQLIDLSPRVVQGTVTDTRLEQEGGSIVLYVTLKVEEWIKGEESAPNSNTVVFKQVAEISEGGETSQQLKLGLPQYEKGKTYLFFLAGDADTTGFTAPVGLHQGIFPMEKENGKWVVPSLKNRTALFKNLQKQVGGKILTSTQSSLEKGATDFDNFKSVIKTMVEE